MVQVGSGTNDLLLRRWRYIYTLARILETTWLVDAVFTLQIATGTFAGACQVFWARQV